eukprot:3945171-Amphidinium_carterae.1
MASTELRPIMYPIQNSFELSQRPKTDSITSSSKRRKRRQQDHTHDVKSACHLKLKLPRLDDA